MGKNNATEKRYLKLNNQKNINHPFKNIFGGTMV